MRRLIGGAVVVCAGFAGGPLRAQEEVPLWKDGAPGFRHDRPETVEDKRETGRLDRWIGYVSEPTLTVYRAPGDAPRPVVLILPGGGYRYVLIDKEGHEAARWVNSLGLAAAVLKYRLRAPDKPVTPEILDAALADAERAVRLLREGAARWRIDAQKVGVLGFSAGGHLAIRLMLEGDVGAADAKDAVEAFDSRPSFLVLVYSGTVPGEPPKIPGTPPPAFIVHAADDPKAPAMVAVRNAEWLRGAGGSVELHVFHRGDHGFGISPKAGTVAAWTALCAAWMRDLRLPVVER